MSFSSLEAEAIVSKLRHEVPRICEGNQEYRDAMLGALDLYAAVGDHQMLRLMLGLKRYPVDVETFMFSSDYLGRPREEVYPEVVSELKKVNNPTSSRLTNPYVEAVYTGGIGAAKCLGRDTPVVMHDGKVKKVQDVQVGDLLLGPDSQPRKVLSLATGFDEMYRVTQKGGLPYTVNSRHILSLQYTDTSNGAKPPRYGRRKGDVVNLDVQQYLALSPKHRGLLKGWRPMGVQFPEAPPVYDPYLLGVWLGDGTSAATSVTSADPEIVSYLKGVAKREGIMLLELEDKRPNKSKRYSLVTYEGRSGQNPVLNWLRKIDVLHNKHVPHAYLTGSESERYALLAGLIDTDGNLSSDRCFVVTQKRKVLSDAIAFLARSLGFRVTVNEDVIGGTTYYRAFISGHLDRIPTRILRKQARLRKQEKEITRWGVAVDAVGQGEYFGFELEGPDRLFLLGDFTVTHNTTSALFTTAYQLYLLSCYKDPHKTFRMDSTSEIMFVFQSMAGALAEGVDYARFREMCEQSYYFSKVYPFDKRIRSELRFPQRIMVKAIETDTGSIGQNVIGGVIDELNFMANIANSKRNPDGGSYNQALVIYNSIARRRMSRFMGGGSMPGILCLVSSKRYPGEFTDVKLKEAQSNPRIYVYDKRVWEVKPPGTYGASGFRVFHGDMTRKASVLPDSAVVAEADKHLITRVPSEFRQSFDDDLVGAMRDIAGISTMSRYPFLHNVEKVNLCFNQHESVFDVDQTDFVNPKMTFSPSVITSKHLPRWVHIDLGLTGDACGLTIGHVPGFMETLSSANKLGREMMPIIKIDGMLRVVAPPNDEIQFYKVRDLLYLLRERGLNIKWVTFDSYQSVDSIQLLRQQGFITGKTSMDTSDDPYNYLKGAIYDGRLQTPSHPWCLTELLSLEQDAKTGKVDHPSTGTKDVADSLAGVVWGLTHRREIWHHFRVPVEARKAGLRDGVSGIKSPLENMR